MKAKSNHTKPLPVQKRTTTLSRRLMRALELVGACLLFTLNSAQAQADCTLLTNGLAAWWPADDHDYEVISFSQAALQNGAVYAPGMVGRAFSFTTSNAKVRIPERTNNDLSRMLRWTIEGWVKPTSFVNSARPTIFSEGVRLATLGIKNGTGELDSWLNNGNQLVGTVPLRSNQWNHIALVYAINTRTFYVNGTNAGSGSAVLVTDDSTGAAIGNTIQDDPTSQFQGQIDELSLYNRALSSNEVAAIFLAGALGKCYTNGGPEPVFFLQPRGQKLFPNSSWTLIALAMGAPRPTYQWFQSGTLVPGATNAELTLNNVNFSDSGDYALLASNVAGIALSEPANITVEVCADIQPGPVAWWPGDGSALDAIGDRHGSLWNDMKFSAGRVGKAFRFDGTSSYIAIQDSAALSPHAGTAGQMTIEAWVFLVQFPQTDPYTGSAGRALLSKADRSRSEYTFYITTAGVPGLEVYANSGGTSVSIQGGPLTLNRWTHLAAVFKKGQFLRLYQDGQLMSESTNAAVNSARGPAPLYMGRHDQGAFFYGLMDEVALFDRALSSEEIMTIYNAGSYGKCMGSGNVAPAFLVQPTNQNGYVLGQTNLAALASGTPRPDYRWYLNDLPVANANNAMLTLPRLGVNEPVRYRVGASNQSGMVFSEPSSFSVVRNTILTNGESFESGWNGWWADNAIWQIGIPSNGPAAAHQGLRVAATGLENNYPNNANARLISPPFVVPSAQEYPRLRFWHWFQTAHSPDFGKVQIRPVGGGWQDVSTNFFLYGGRVWSRTEVDLAAFAGRTIQVAFYFQSDGSANTPGWYIDEVQLVTGPPVLPNPEGFESGWGDWYADNGVWEVGVPTSGPGSAHSGSRVAATGLAGNYSDYSQPSRLISPPFVVPAAGENPRLRFSHWFSTPHPADSGKVQIRLIGGSWQDIAGPFFGTGGRAWTPYEAPLSTFSQRAVQIAYVFQSDGSSADAGWDVDDVFIRRGSLTIGTIADKTVNEGLPLMFPVPVSGTNSSSCLGFRLGDGAPDGASIGPASGVFLWTPAECQGPRTYLIPIYIVDYCNGEANDMTVVKVTVNEVNARPVLVPAEKSVRVGRMLQFYTRGWDVDCPTNVLTYSLLAGAPTGVSLNTNTGVIRWTPTLAQARPQAYSIGVRVCDNGTPRYCTDATFYITVTTNADFGLQVDYLGYGFYEFTILGGNPNLDYILQETDSVREWPDTTQWHNIQTNSPTEMPFKFLLYRPDLEESPVRFFRLKDKAR